MNGILAFVGMLVFCPMIAAEAQEATWDPAEIAHLAEKSAQSALALSQMVESLANLQKIALTTGKSGFPLNPGFTPLNGTQGLQGLEQGAVTGAAGSAGSLPTSFLQTRQQAAQDGIALSLYGIQDVSLAASESNVLLSEIQSATDLRGDVEANTATALTALTIVEKLKAMLALIVEIRAANRLTFAMPQIQGGT